MVLALAALWTAFIIMEIAKAVYFNGFGTPLLIYLLFGAYLYLPWFAISVFCGVLAQYRQHLPLFSTSSLLFHLPIALAVSTLHVLVLTSAWWVFWPERVTQVSFGFVLGEQAFKWAHFEILAYFLLIALWRRQLNNGENNSELSGGAESGELSLMTDTGLVKLNAEQIEWLLADDNYVVIHADARTIRVRATMKEMLSQLHGKQFQQTHRSAIVNMAKVKEVGSQRVTLDSGCRVPVSRRRHRQLLEAFNR